MSIYPPLRLHVLFLLRQFKGLLIREEDRLGKLRFLVTSLYFTLWDQNDIDLERAFNDQAMIHLIGVVSSIWIYA